jgi:hypothetical protein
VNYTLRRQTENTRLLLLRLVLRLQEPSPFAQNVKARECICKIDWHAVATKGACAHRQLLCLGGC